LNILVSYGLGVNRTFPVLDVSLARGSLPPAVDYSKSVSEIRANEIDHSIAHR
jgi:hypothetical protein